MSLMRTLSGLGTAAVVLAGSASYALSPEAYCLKGRAKAAGKYAKCIANEVANYYSAVGDAAKLGKCVTKYGATWAKLQSKALASPGVETCDAARYVDNGDGTVTDNLTTLQWEKKANLDTTLNLADPHDADNVYTWSAAASSADGTAFTSFLAMLNGGGFAGHYDWRLPTLTELLSITQPAFPDCSAPPCLDPIFGPTVSGPGGYWPSSTYAPSPPDAWSVVFVDGGAGPSGKLAGLYVRAVRGGS